MYHGRGTYAPFCRSACTICAVDVHHSGRRIHLNMAIKAIDRILQQAGKNAKKRKKTVDAVAASLILEGYLDYKRLQK